ncbi:MAG: MarR family transcriptional regulator [Halieaceae bacterium]|jgi:DNA-binding MarR family transcriptional regulator|nr:MarR family transcriptional regulator [Halieaceae bacterium]
MNDQLTKSESVVMQILATAATLERGLDSALSHSRGVTFSEYRLLRTLQAAEHGLTRVALARTLSVSPSGVTRALKPLEKLGYVVTEKNSRDARQSLAKLTRGGRDLLSDAKLVLADFLRELKIENVNTQVVASAEHLLIELQQRRASRQ